MKTLFWGLVVTFLIFFAATEPQAAAQLTHSIWDVIVNVFNGLASFVESFTGSSSG